MPVVTATEVTVYSNITASAATIAASGLIPLVQERLLNICNNDFASDIYVVATATFAASSITLIGNDWSTFGFADGDEILVKSSYRNDGYYEIESFSGTVANLATGYTCIDELSGNTVIISLVYWPLTVKRGAALMIAYDYDTRAKRVPGLVEYTLGPFKERYNVSDKGQDYYGYPQDILGSLPLPVAGGI